MTNVNCVISYLKCITPNVNSIIALIYFDPDHSSYWTATDMDIVKPSVSSVGPSF